jgi:hypothetical protein
MLMRVVQGRFLGVLLGVRSESVGGIAMVRRFFMVAFFQVLSSSAVVLQGVLEIVSGLFVGLDDFLVFFGVVSHGKGKVGK